MLIVETVWWLMFMTVVGLAVGSFLNVVIYRLPLGQSVMRPTMSHCPACGAGIRWHDNLPVVSYLRLGGRCRDCRSGISVRYPVIELLFGLIVLMLVDAFCVAHARPGLIENRHGLSWQIIEDGPLVAAHLILFAALLAMSAIDMEHYWVDVRATGIATACGFVLHAVWTPRRTPDWPRPDDGTALVCLGALVGLGLMAAILRLRYGRQPDLDECDSLSSDRGHPDQTGEGGSAPQDAAAETPTPPTPISP